jgi:hypothetical protein
MWLKEAHVVVFVPHGNQHFTQCQQKCHELHHGSHVLVVMGAT